MSEKMKNPLELEKEREEKYLSFSDKWEEELKRQLFEEEQNSEEDNDLPQIMVSEVEFHKPRPTEEWDVPIGEEIKYFDPELSYEITGYRPITMEKGLDFNPDVFRERAITYNKTKKYTEFPKGCKPYHDFWKEEFRRCNEGYTVGKYRVTGDHYFFLNYYRMSIIVEGSDAGSGRVESFPNFIAKQYEWFHYLEMAEKLHKDVCALKSRGVGWSEMTASSAIRPYTTKRGYNVMLTAFDSIKLDGLKQKCWTNLDWLNIHTGGGMRHLRQKYNNDDTKKASLVSVDGTEHGWMSMITSVIASTADKVRGPRLDRLIYEEAGSNKILTESWIKGNALVELGGFHLGTRIALGTGGDDMALEGLSTMFRKPNAYNVMPYKNYDTDDGKPEISAFFLPAHKFSLLSEYVDDRGVTDCIRFKKFYEEQRAKLSDKDYLNECAEHCFTPREALSKHGDNVFDPAPLAERMIQISQGMYTKPKHIQLLWDKTVGNGLTKVIAKESASSHLLVVEPPLLDDTGKPYKNLYVAGIDAIDMGTNDSSSDSGVSDFCVVIKKRIFGLNDPKYVAMYKFRPADIRQAYDLTMKLLVWYNCKALLEYTKISIRTYFKDKGKDNLFMKRPEVALNGTSKGRNKNLVGLPATEAMIRHGLELINNFINDYWHTIDYQEMLDQMLNYSYENKRKFDIIAALQMAEIADEDLSGINPSTVSTVKNQWKDFGYYTDANGIKHRGVIPKR